MFGDMSFGIPLEGTTRQTKLTIHFRSNTSHALPIHHQLNAIDCGPACLKRNPERS